jgi:hypothetical protein
LAGSQQHAEDSQQAQGYKHSLSSHVSPPIELFVVCENTCGGIESSYDISRVITSFTNRYDLYEQKT